MSALGWQGIGRRTWICLGAHLMISDLFPLVAMRLKVLFGQDERVHAVVSEQASLPAGRQFPAASFYLLIAAILAPACFFLYDLGAYPLRDNNEGLYAEIAREMLVSRDFIVPHLLGVPYIEKPPLLYWLTALSFQFFGFSETSARLASGLPMACLAFGIFTFCRAVSRPTAGFFAVLILSTALPVTLLSRTVLFDPLLTALLGGVLLGFLQWYAGKRRYWLRLSALLLALAVLDKGGVALVLATGIIGTFLLLVRDMTTWRSFIDPIAVLIFLTVAAPWHIFAAWHQDGFAWFYFVNEHLLRFFGMREPRDYHTGPLYYYLPRIALMLLPWTPFFILLPQSSKAGNAADAILYRFCQAWVLFPLLFFSLSQAKADYYLIVAAPGCALWLGLMIEHRMNRQSDRALTHCFAAAVTASLLGIYMLLDAGRSHPSIGLNHALIGIGVVSCGVIWIFSVRLHRAVQSKHYLHACALASPALFMIPALLLALHAAHAKSIQTSSRGVAELIRSADISPAVVFAYRDFEDVFSTLPFYLQRTIRIIDSSSRDLQFGCRVSDGPDNACISPEEFKKYWERFPVAVAVRQKNVEAFRNLIGHQTIRSKAVGDKWVFFNY